MSAARPAMRGSALAALAALGLALSLATAVRAEAQAKPVAATRGRGLAMIGVSAGGVLPYGFSELQGSYLIGVELGYVLPVLAQRLALGLGAGFTAPTASGTGTDPRLSAGAGDGSYTWQLEQRELILGLTLYYRHPLGRWTPYLGLGPRLLVLQSRVRGQAGPTRIATSTEVSAQAGVGIPVGVGVHLGPGELFAELAFSLSNLDHRSTGETLNGFLSLAAGYRLLF